ncbi:MAG: type II toxin-antitoxin system VapC family toxin [Candidatus Hodarchaeales archaeon]
MTLRFIDASAILYAVIEPKKPLSKQLMKMKFNAKNILKRINAGEQVVTSVVHLSEVSNILEALKPFSEVATFITDLMLKDSIQILDVSANDYKTAAFLAKRYEVGVNDTLAKLLMDSNNIGEIYSFDKHFDSLRVKRITQ